jgi:hypothetical protein
MRHDFKTVAFSIARKPDRIPQHHLWTLWKDGTTVEACTRMVPAGPELRIYHNGTFLRSEDVKAEWVGRGWVE